MNILRLLALSLVGLLFVFSNTSFAAINYTVTPIRYELNLEPGESITLPASIRNNGTGTVTLPTTSSDFQSNGSGGVPSLVRKSELVFPNQELSTWITLGSPDITLAAGQEGSVDFTIDVPTNATPGGHYGAVLFRNPGSVTGGGNISINVDYGIIILVNVAGNINVGAVVGNPVISGGFYGGVTTHSGVTLKEDDDAWYIGTDEEGNPVYDFTDTCPLGDYTPSKYDGSCFITPDSDEENSDLPVVGGNEDDFNVNFSFPIKNIGNTHIKPTGKVTLIDEDGNIIKAIGREIISNEQGAVIGEKIVDYIPINDGGGNILPQTERIFQSEWRGFPYKTYDDEGNQIFNYWSPSEYYTTQNENNAGFLMFWERVTENRQHKMITAEIEMTYYDEKGNPIEYNTAKEFPVQYIEQVVTINPYIILALVLILVSILFTWFGVRWWVVVCKRKKCWNCKEKIKSHWEACPHCSAIQNKKKHKAYEKQKELEKKNLTKRKVATKKTSTKKVTTKKTSMKK